MLCVWIEQFLFYKKWEGRKNRLFLNLRYGCSWYEHIPEKISDFYVYVTHIYFFVTGKKNGNIIEWWTLCYFFHRKQISINIGTNKLKRLEIKVPRNTYINHSDFCWFITMYLALLNLRKKIEMSWHFGLFFSYFNTVILKYTFVITDESVWI